MMMTTTSTITEFQNNNASLKIHWEDTMDNYTVQREKEIEKYFKAKYKTDKVKVIFKAILSKKSDTDVAIASVTNSEMVLDDNYQKTLIEQYLKDSDCGVPLPYIDRLDNRVNLQLEDYKDNTNRYKKFRIKEVTFSNFLSYGKKNKIDFEGRPGITSIISYPCNFGGKTTATIDVLLFLFFGDTTKSEKNADIFNRYTNDDTLSVRGEIEMDGDSYVIERTLIRTRTKGDEIKITGTIEFQKKLNRGGYKNLKGDEKKLTEELIKTYVGTKEDFLITILSTGDNLDDLIKTKPTERGRILTRFIGLEYFREKEKIAKRLYDQWKDTSKLHHSNMEQIHKDLKAYQSTLTDTGVLKENSLKELQGLTTKVNALKNEQENLLLQRVTIDENLYKYKEEDLEAAIHQMNQKITQVTNDYEVAKASLVEPDTFFDVDKLKLLEINYKTLEREVLEAESDIRTMKNNNVLLKESENCPSYKRALDGVDFTPQIAANESIIENLVTKISNKSKLIVLSLEQIEQIKKTQGLWDEYHRKQLVADHTHSELQRLLERKKNGELFLSKFKQNGANLEKNRLIDTDLGVLKVKLANFEEQRDIALMTCKGYEKDVNEAERKIEDYNLLLSQIRLDEATDKVFRTYIEIYGKNGISKTVLATMIPLINHNLKSLLSETCEFVLQMRMNEKNEVEFWMMDDEASGIGRPLLSGSGFEKTVSSLALRCVLTKVSSLPKPNIILFDEVFSRVGNDNLDKIGLFFDKIKEYFEHIWLISHNPLITEWADHTIKIHKKDKISEILPD